MQITSVINQKGGVGKTALSVGVSAALAELGHRVLLIDLDPQGHATAEFLALPEPVAPAPTLADAMSGRWQGTAKELAVPYNRVQFPNSGSLDVIPSSAAMLTLIRRLEQSHVKEQQLTKILDTVDYEHVVIDCPPALDVLSNNALTVTDGVLVPVQPHRTSVRALRLLQAQMAYIEKALPREPIANYGIVAGLYRRPMPTYSVAVMEEFATFGLPMLPHLPLNVVITEAAAHGLPVTAFAPQSGHALALREIAWRIDTTFQGKHRRRIEPPEEFVFSEFVSAVARSGRERASGEDNVRWLEDFGRYRGTANHRR
ncbi:MAG: ParA family protein [Sciscionella sp.]